MDETAPLIPKPRPSDEYTAERPLTSLRVFSSAGFAQHRALKQKLYDCWRTKYPECRAAGKWLFKCLRFVPPLAPFEFQPHDLREIVGRRDFLALKSLTGGTDRLMKGLFTSTNQGIVTCQDSSAGGMTSHDFGLAPLVERRRIYGRNRAWDSSLGIIYQLARNIWKPVALMIYVNLFLLALELVADFKVRTVDDRMGSWAASAVILIVIFILMFFEVLVHFRMAHQIRDLYEEIEGPKVKVIRDGVKQKIKAKDTVVGDVVFLYAGAIVPCDGIFLTGRGVACDESKREGTRPGAGTIRKVSMEHIARMMYHADPRVRYSDCFMHSGDRVLEGSGRYVVTAISNEEMDPLPAGMFPGLGEKSEHEYLLGKACTMTSLVLFVVLTVRFFIRLRWDDTLRTTSQRVSVFIDIVTLSVFLGMIVYLPQCLPSPLCIQRFCAEDLIRDKILLRMPNACEVMATVTDFCLDMTGTITQDRMTVVSGLVGIRTQFALRRAGHAAGYQPQNDQLGVIEDIEALDIRLSVSPPLQCLLNNIITLTSIATQDVDPFTGDIMFLGDVTEIALLQFAKEFEWPDIQSVRSAANILDVVPFSSERMASGAFVDIGEGRRRLYMKGASEILAKRCTRYIHVDEELQEDLRPKMPTFPIGGYAEGIINATLTSYTKQGLRTLALCYRDFESWPPDDMPNDGVAFEDYARDLVFVGIVCIYNPMRQRVPTTIGSIKGSGITVRLCTGDHLETAVSIAERCGIYTGVPGLLHSALSCIQVGAKLGQNDRIARWLQVLARASPEDKARLVASLRDRNRIVAFLGDGINDRLALEEANISFSMAVEGTEVAKQASDIALMNNNLDSVLNVLRWGRCILDCRQSFIDLYIPMGLTLLSITSVSAVLSSTAKPALSLVQLVWITFLINPLAALALSTSRPSESGIEGDAAPRPPAIQSGVHYSVVQVSLVLSFFFGHVLLGHPLAESVADISARTRTQIFNTVAFMQIFRTLTIRKLDRTSVMANGLFAIILAAGSFNTFLLHLLIVLAGGSMFDVTPMNGYEWTSSIVLAVIVILVTSLYKRWTLYAQRIEEELPTAEWGEQGH